MSSTTSAPDVLDGLLSIDGVVPSFETWPGLDSKREMLWLGEITWDASSDGYRIATVKAARKQRQENYEIEFELWVAGEGSTPDDVTPSRNRAFEILAAYENALAEDVTANTSFNVVQWVEIRPRTAGPRQFEKGWAYRIAGAFSVAARLL